MSPCFADTYIFYPDAATGSTTVDGSLVAYDRNQTFADIRSNNASFVQASTANTWIIGIKGSATEDQFERLFRSIYTIDTSELTAEATIVSATFSLRGYDKTDSGTAITPDIDIYLSTPAANNALAVADFLQIGTTSQTGSPITYAGWSTTTYNNFTLLSPGNTEGCDRISLTGITKLGARNANYDVTGTPPTWSTPEHSISGYFADQTGTTFDPKLTVNTPSAATGAFLNFMD